MSVKKSVTKNQLVNSNDNVSNFNNKKLLVHNTFENFNTQQKLVNINKVKDHKDTSCITLAYLLSKTQSDKTKRPKRYRVLFDTGYSSSLINKEMVKDLPTELDDTQRWVTKSGYFNTSKKCLLKLTLPQLHKHREIQWTMHVDETTPNRSNYEMIIGRDLMHELGLIINFQEGRVYWDNAWINMQDPILFSEMPIEEFEEELFMMHDPVTTDAQRIQDIIDAKYCPADLEKEVNKTKLSLSQKATLLKLLKKFKTLFDGSLGTWETKPVELQLKDPNTKPVYIKPYPVPKSREVQLKEECKRLVQQGILRKVNHSEWGMPAFTIVKPDGSLRSLADLRALNKLIKRMPFPLPKIQDMLLKLEKLCGQHP